MMLLICPVYERLIYKEDDDRNDIDHDLIFDFYRSFVYPLLKIAEEAKDLVDENKLDKMLMMLCNFEYKNIKMHWKSVHVDEDLRVQANTLIMLQHLVDGWNEYHDMHQISFIFIQLCIYVYYLELKKLPFNIFNTPLSILSKHLDDHPDCLTFQRMQDPYNDLVNTIRDVQRPTYGTRLVLDALIARVHELHQS